MANTILFECLEEVTKRQFEEAAKKQEELKKQLDDLVKRATGKDSDEE